MPRAPLRSESLPDEIRAAKAHEALAQLLACDKWLTGDKWVRAQAHEALEWVEMAQVIAERDAGACVKPMEVCGWCGAPMPGGVTGPGCLNNGCANARPIRPIGVP